MDDAAWLEELSKRTGASVEQSDVERLKSTNEDDRGRLMEAYESQYARRGASGQTGSGMDDKEATARGYGSARSETAESRGGASPAQAWNSQGGIGQMAGGNTGVNGNMFPDWYRTLLEQQMAQQQAQQAESKAKADALYGQLNERATQGLAIDRNNPVIRQQADAFSANQERAKRNYLSDVAEEAGPLANIRGEQRMAAERYGATTGAFEAELMGRELMARREEIADALRMQGAMLSGEQQRTLQQQLALLDQAIQEQQIALGYRGQDLDYSLGQQGLGVQRRGQDIGYDSFLRELALREWDLGNQNDYRWALL